MNFNPENLGLRGSATRRQSPGLRFSGMLERTGLKNFYAEQPKLFIALLVTFLLVITTTCGRLVGPTQAKQQPTKQQRITKSRHDNSKLSDLQRRLNRRGSAPATQQAAQPAPQVDTKDGLKPLNAQPPVSAAAAADPELARLAKQRQEVIAWQRQQWEQAQKSVNTSSQLDQNSRRSYRAPDYSTSYSQSYTPSYSSYPYQSTSGNRSGSRYR